MLHCNHALELVWSFFQDWICSFEKPKTEPNKLSPSTTVLSPYLKFGCLSARKFYGDLQDVYAKKVKFS